MRNTLSAHRALAESFERDKAERIQSMQGWISDTETRLEEARRRVAELPQQIAKMQEELAELERLEMVPLNEMVREAKPLQRVDLG
jgi:septal ring factor EnvC (AmiA/AmiB activator)